MTERNDDRETREDEALEALVAEAFSSRGELPPTTESEVARAEADEVEFTGDLPPALRAFDDSQHDRASAHAPGKVVRLDEERERRGAVPAWFGYATTALLGAAAASVFWIWFGNRPSEVTPSPATDPSSAATAPSAKPVAVAIGPVHACPSPCCAGASCAAAEGVLEQCSSGRECIPCSLDHLRGSLYRLRIGSLALSRHGQEMREKEGWGPLELCARVGSADASCIAAHAGTQGDEVWATLPVLVSAQDLAAGFELHVRRKGAPKPMATWKHAVLTNPTLLCRGLSVSPKRTGDGPIGTLSVFFEDTHFVELGRDASASVLVDKAKSIAFADVTPRIYETTQKGGRHFALSVGPLDKPTAERLRWKLLDANLEAAITVGNDHVGEPRGVKE